MTSKQGAYHKARRLKAEQVREPRERRRPEVAREHEDRVAAEERAERALMLVRPGLPWRSGRHYVHHFWAGPRCPRGRTTRRRALIPTHAPAASDFDTTMITNPRVCPAIRPSRLIANPPRKRNLVEPCLTTTPMVSVKAEQTHLPLGEWERSGRRGRGYGSGQFGRWAHSSWCIRVTSQPRTAFDAAGACAVSPRLARKRP